MRPGGYLDPGFARHDYGSGSSGRHRNLQLELATVDAPVAHDLAVNRIVRCSCELQIADHRRLNNEMLEPRRFAVAANSCDAFGEPRADRDERVMNVRLARPTLPTGSCAV